jgi:hypothetical protein
MARTKVKYDKPIYTGFAILEVSKNLMYDFHYNYVKKKWGNSKLLMTDTDSLMYEIETEDFYEDIRSDVSELFDMSNYEVDHPSRLASQTNKKVVGLMKDEAGGKVIEEMVGLRAKLYSIKIGSGEAGEERKRCKGVKKSVVKKNVTHEDYKKCLFGGEKLLRKMNVIRSHRHNIYSEEVNKVALSRDDDKRTILDDGINTTAIGFLSVDDDYLEFLAYEASARTWWS